MFSIDPKGTPLHPTTHRALIGRHRVTAAVAFACALLALSLSQAPSAHAAGTYANLACDPASPAIADAYGGWSPVGNAALGNGVYTANNCTWGGLHTELEPAGGHSVGAWTGLGWDYAAPANTRIKQLQMQLGGWNSNAAARGVISVDASTEGRLRLYAAADNQWPTRYSFDSGALSSTHVTVLSGCDSATGCSQATSWFDAQSAKAYLADDSAPVAGSTSGSAKDDPTWKGTESFAYGATDDGGGVYAYRLYVDGNVVDSHVPDSFGGHCATISTEAFYGGTWVFGYPKPCPGSVNETVSVDTTGMADGSHTVAFKVVDAAGREATLYTATKLVANHPPVNTVAPSYETKSIADKALVGI